MYLGMCGECRFSANLCKRALDVTADVIVETTRNADILYIKMSVSLSVYVCVPYRSPHRSSDCDETFTSCKHSGDGFGNSKNLKIVLAGVLGVALSLQGHTPFIRSRWDFHKLLETCSRWFWKFKKLKSVLAGVSGVALHSDLDEILHTWPSKQEKSDCLHDHPPLPIHTTWDTRCSNVVRDDYTYNFPQTL